MIHPQYNGDNLTYLLTCRYYIGAISEIIAKTSTSISIYHVWFFKYCEIMLVVG